MTTYNEVTIYRARGVNDLDLVATCHPIAALFHRDETGLWIDDDQLDELLPFDKWLRGRDLHARSPAYGAGEIAASLPPQ